MQLLSQDNEDLEQGGGGGVVVGGKRGEGEEEEEEGHSLMQEVEIGGGRAGSSPLEAYLAQLRSREIQQQQHTGNGDGKQQEGSSDEEEEEDSDSDDSDDPRPSHHRRGGRPGSSTVSVPSSMKLTFCRKCDGLRPPRAHHCMICGRCIMKVGLCVMGRD